MKQEKPNNEVGNASNAERERNIENIAKALEIEKSELIKEPWIETFLDFKEKLDSSSYIDEINKNEQKNGGFNEKYFTEKWPYSIYSIAGAINFKELLKLFRSGKITNPSHIFTEEELKSNFSEVKISKKEKIKGKEVIIEKTIEEICREQKERAKTTLTGTKNANDSAIDRNFQLLNTPLGKIILHDYISIGKYPNGVDKTNIIYSDLGFLATRAFGFDTFIEFNQKNGFFSITSKDKLKLKELGEKLGMKNLEGLLVLRRGSNGMTEEEFLNIIDPNILKEAKNLKNGELIDPKIKEFEERNKNIKEKKDEKKGEEYILSLIKENPDITPELEEVIEKELEKIKKRMEEREEVIKKIKEEIEKRNKQNS